MKITFKELTYKNFLSRGDDEMTLKLDTGRSTFLTGENGEGKSTNASAILFALFGKVERDLKKSEIPNYKNKKNCLVTLSFDKGDKSYKIVRGISPDILEIHLNGELTDKDASVKDTQKRIEAIVGIDFFNFCQQTVVSATNYVPFPKMKTEERRKFIEHIFATYVLTDMLKLHKEDVKALNLEKTEVKKDFDRLASQLDYETNNITYYESDLKSKQDRINAQVETLKTSYRDSLIKDNQSQMDKLVEGISKEESLDHNERDRMVTNQKIDTLRKELLEVSGTLFKLEQSAKGLDDLQNDLKFMQNDLISASEEAVNVKRERDDIGYKGKTTKKKLEEAETRVNCPTCNEPIKDRDAIISSLKDELSGYTTSWGELNEDYKAKALIASDLENRKDSLVTEITAKQDIIHRYNQLQNREELLHREIEHLSSLKFDSLNSKLISLRQKLEDLKSYDVDKVVDEKVKDELSKLDMLDFDRLKTMQDYKDKVQSEYNVTKNRMDKNFENLEYAKVMTDFLKDDGIKSIVVRRYLPILNQRVNYFLDKLGLFLHFEMGDTFDLSFMDSYVHKLPYNGLSEGQKNRVDVAIMLAFRDIIKIKNSTDFNIFILDDVFGKVDDKGVSDICSLIEDNEDDITLLFINHKRDLYEHAFEDVIVFYRNELGFTQHETS